MNTRDYKDIHKSLSRKGSSYTLEDVKNGVAQLENVSNALIVMNMPNYIYSNQKIKKEFEDFFKEFDEKAQFVYLPGFNRVRITFQSTETAILAHQKADEALLSSYPPNLSDSKKKDEKIKCFFAQNNSSAKELLELPKKERQYLISPPASPPDDWQPKLEATPAINYDLLAAIASLKPGESHEVQAPTLSLPGIMITPSFNPADVDTDKPMNLACHKDYNPTKMKIVQTRCPERH